MDAVVDVVDDASPTRGVERRRAGPAALLLALAAIGCGDGESPLEPDVEPTTMLDIVTDRTVYESGREGAVVATSKADGEIAVDLCPWELDRWSGRAWELHAERPDPESCLPVLRVLRSGQVAIVPFVLPPDVPPGDYRLRFERIFDADMVRLPVAERVSRPFRIEP